QLVEDGLIWRRLHANWSPQGLPSSETPPIPLVVVWQFPLTHTMHVSCPLLLTQLLLYEVVCSNLRYWMLFADSALLLFWSSTEA
ncbi:hypothetical protein PMAYCL1PPCAC_01120, partial [Pristionchus mayeri]